MKFPEPVYSAIGLMVSVHNIVNVTSNSADKSVQMCSAVRHKIAIAKPYFTEFDLRVPAPH